MDSAEVERIKAGFRLLGCDNFSVHYDALAKGQVCEVGWKSLHVKGYGVNAPNAMIDAYNKIRQGVAEDYSILLPDVLNGELPESVR